MRKVTIGSARLVKSDFNGSGSHFGSITYVDIQVKQHINQYKQ